MNKKYLIKIISIVLIALFTTCDTDAQKSDKNIPEGIWVRAGYELSVAVNPKYPPRHITQAPDGALYFSSLDSEIITCAKDNNGDGYYETLTEYHKAKNVVYYVLWHEGEIWFTESGAIYKTKDSNGDGKADDVTAVLPNGKLPDGGGHAWRPLLINNGRIYTGMGDSGNISEEPNSERQKIWSFDMNGNDKKLFASGIRNTEKLVLRPGTNEIWGMDHGSDWFGRKVGDSRERQPITDNNPPEEMNKYVEGGFYGHPYIVGNRLPRYEYMHRKDIIELAEKTIVPEWMGGAHWAANAMMFYTGDNFSSEHKGDAFVAYHGSWNRSKPGGYQVTRVLFENGKPFGEKAYVKFIDENYKIAGRPVDVINDNKSGGILITEDGMLHETNFIYRLTEKKK